jgi:hypothetical protein
MRVWREKHPVKAAFHRKKWNAKIRGIQFELTFEEFSSVWAPGYVIDRKNALFGYIAGNIQKLPPLDNAIKGATIDKEAHNNIPF